MISVVIPTHNPHAGRLQRTLDGLAAQTLPSRDWELVVVDNGSSPALTARVRDLGGHRPRIIREDALGLTSARLAGIGAATGEILVFVDDDNVLSPDYLATIAGHFRASPALGAAGGPVLPEWQSPPPAWSAEFHGLLALRDLGDKPLIAQGGANTPWPKFAPVGAGLAVRLCHARAYAATVKADPRRREFDRRGTSLASGGDNDLVFTALHGGADLAYLPEARLTHLIPAERLEVGYLARLNRGLMRTWVGVLALHGQCPWNPVSRSTVPLRAARAWLRLRAWRGPAQRIRWSGALGQFQGQADVHAWRHEMAR